MVVFSKSECKFKDEWFYRKVKQYCLGVGTGGREEDIRKGYGRVNMVKILCAHV
jgi:hypothetical protein